MTASNNGETGKQIVQKDTLPSLSFLIKENCTINALVVEFYPKRSPKSK